MTLSTGINIDLTTCGETPAALAKTKQMISKSFEYLKCLAEVNPDIAQKVLNYFSTQTPSIRCAGHLKARPNSESLVASACRSGLSLTQERACIQTTFSNKPVAAFNITGSSEVVMVSADPVVTGANQDDNAQTFIHEMMHAAGIPDEHHLHNGDDGRNNALWRYADPIYGFNMLCGGSPPGSEMNLKNSAEPTKLLRVISLLNRNEKIQMPDGTLFTPPGSIFEIGCTALRQARPGYSCYTFLPPTTDACPQASVAPTSTQTLTSIDPYCKAKADRLNTGPRPGEMSELDREHNDQCSPTSADFVREKHHCLQTYCPNHPDWSSCKQICIRPEYSSSSFCIH